MGINLSVPQTTEILDMNPKITVIGVGGAGGNAINNMIQSELGGVEFVVCNTDSQALGQSKSERRLQLGNTLTSGLGAGSKPEVGQAAAEESMDQIIQELQGSHMAFIAAGMGGGTGTGAAPVIARTAKELGILTVGVVTKPFQFEGAHRMRLAEEGIRELEQYVDTLIIIPNQNLFRIANENTTFADAFKMADDVLHSGVRGVTDLMVMPGLINLDFADIRSVMSEMGKAMMGTGEAQGERRALDAAEAAIANPLLDDSSMKGAKGVLINITGGSDITLFEVDEAANRVRDEVDEDAYIIIGSAFDDTMNGTMRVSVVATGIDAGVASQSRPTILKIDDAITPVTSTQIAREIGELAIAAEALGAVETTSEAVTEHVAAESDLLDPLSDLEHAETMGNDRPAIEMMVDENTTNENGLAAELDGNETPETTTGIAPNGTPSLNQTDAFIPREAMAATSTQSPSPDVFDAADMINGAGHEKLSEPAPQATPQKTEKRSLFERVTGLRKNTDTQSSSPSSVMPFMVRSEKRAAPENKPQPASTDGVQNQAEQSSAENQSHLGGLEATDRVENMDVKDELLDIPAFLRRQAN